MLRVLLLSAYNVVSMKIREDVTSSRRVSEGVHEKVFIATPPRYSMALSVEITHYLDY